MLQQCAKYDKCMLHFWADLSELVMPVTLGVRLSPVAADYAARTLHNSEIKNDFVLHHSNVGLTLRTVHTILLLNAYWNNYTAAQYSLASKKPSLSAMALKLSDMTIS